MTKKNVVAILFLCCIPRLPLFLPLPPSLSLSFSFFYFSSTSSFFPSFSSCYFSLRIEQREREREEKPGEACYSLFLSMNDKSSTPTSNNINNGIEEYENERRTSSSTTAITTTSTTTTSRKVFSII